MSKATVSCKCGACCIQFASKECVWRLECCCYNCTSALWYANKKGGPPLPAHQLLDSVWFPNDFKVVKGEDKLGAFLSYEGADTTRFHCKECWTCLVADHPAYGGKIALTQASNYDDGLLQGAELMAPRARHFLKDLSAEQAAALPPYSGDKAHEYQGVAENFMGALPDVLAKGGTGEMNLQALLEKVDPATVPTEADSAARLGGGPPSLMAQGKKAAEDAAAL